MHIILSEKKVPVLSYWEESMPSADGTPPVLKMTLGQMLDAGQQEALLGGSIQIYEEDTLVGQYDGFSIVLEQTLALSKQIEGQAQMDALRGELEHSNTRLMATAQALALQVGDQDALHLMDVWPEWAADTRYPQDMVLVRAGQAYRVKKAHTSHAHQPPEAEGMLAIYRPIVLTATGALEDPIPFVAGMDVEAGKYYTYQGTRYLAKGDLPACHAGWAPGTPGMWQWEAASETA